jgi:hypothetical protein
MRNASTLVGLTLFALAGSARAQEAAPAATATPAGDAAASLQPPPVAATPATAAANVAAAPDAAPVSPAASRRKLELGLAFLPMGLGKFTASPGGTPKTVDAAFAYGAALSASYEILPGLLVGLAPQFTFNVKDKKATDKAKQVDLLARVAYAYRPAEKVTAYAEVLPGYSLIIPPSGGVPKGFVLAFGAGAAMDLTDRFFANVGAGYQIGFQNRMEGSTKLQTRTSYVRVILGGGVRF